MVFLEKDRPCGGGRWTGETGCDRPVRHTITMVNPVEWEATPTATVTVHVCSYCLYALRGHRDYVVKPTEKVDRLIEAEREAEEAEWTQRRNELDDLQDYY